MGHHEKDIGSVQHEILALFHFQNLKEIFIHVEKHCIKTYKYYNELFQRYTPVYTTF